VSGKVAAETTLDSLFAGDLALQQPKRGYRVTVDAIILARFIAESLAPVPQLADLGAGSGAVGLALAKFWPQSRVALVEIQSSLAELAAGNIDRNDLGQRVSCHEADLRAEKTWELFPAPTLVVSNPPFYAKGTGRLNPVEQEAIARHELHCSLAEMFNRVGTELKPGGRFAVIHLAGRKDDVLAGYWASGFEIEILRFVFPADGRPATRILVVGKRVEGEVGREIPAAVPPLFVHREPGVYTEEMARYLGTMQD
jgi:tRNA1Val (adenine37-N6)-methyltransferase